MSRERDFSTVTFKVNTAGSWANLVGVPTERYDEAKAACTALAKAAGDRVKFKILDAAGGEIESYGYDRAGTGLVCWHAPKRAS